MISKQIITQISGKYSNEDNGLFELKTQLEEIGIEVIFPENAGIVAYKDSIPLTFIPSPEKSFYDVELAFFESIRNCDFHMVHNNYKEQLGYIGFSTSHEICYAIKEGKKIIIRVNKIFFSDKVPNSLQNVIITNASKFIILPNDFIKQGIDFFQKINGPCTYELTEKDSQAIGDYVEQLLLSYKN